MLLAAPSAAVFISGLQRKYMFLVVNDFVDSRPRLDVAEAGCTVLYVILPIPAFAISDTKCLIIQITYSFDRPLMKTAAEGAASSIYAATSPNLEGITGKYYGLKGEEKPSDKYYSPKNEQIVWDYSMNIIKPYL